MSISTMTSRERFIAAVKNEQPDRVPACPCLSYMVPAHRTGKPFWKVAWDADPPLWKAYLDAVRYFGIDGRLIYGGLRFTDDKAAMVKRESVREQVTPTRARSRTRITTPAGDLTTTGICDIDNPPTMTEKMIKDLRGDLPKLAYLFTEPTSYDATAADAMRREAGEDAVFCLSVIYPGFHQFNDFFDGGLEAAVAAYCDDPEPFEQLRLLVHNSTIAHARLMLDYRPDILYLGGSGTLTLSTPDWVRQFCLPTIKEVTRMAREAGVPTMLHSCGKERLLVDMFASETDLNCVNPLEAAPMGDCDLAEVKAAWGHRLSLAGNIHTTEVMLRGTPETVDAACREAIDAAGSGGGFLLMTGDQCGRDTPEENIFAFVEAAKRYGT